MALDIAAAAPLSRVGSLRRHGSLRRNGSLRRHDSARDSSEAIYTSIMIKCETDAALKANVQSIRKFAARNIYTKSTTTLHRLSMIEQPNEELTALPLAPPTKPIRRKPKKHDLVVSSVRSHASTENLEDAQNLALRPSRSMGDLRGGDLEDDKKKESIWRRFVLALKKSFRKDKEPALEAREMVIGGPTDFKHLQTGTACLPGNPVLPAPEHVDAENEISGDWETVRQSESTFRREDSFQRQL